MSHQTKTHRLGIIRFDWMGYPVIGLPHFEQRRAERLFAQPMTIGSRYFADDDEAIKHCFRLLEAKHGEMEAVRAAAVPNNTVFVAGFETDDFDNRNRPLWFFMVFSIDTKLSNMNGVKVGDTSVNLISTGLFDRKNKTELKPGETEVVIGYRDQGCGFEWTDSVPR